MATLFNILPARKHFICSSLGKMPPVPFPMFVGSNACGACNFHYFNGLMDSVISYGIMVVVVVLGCGDSVTADRCTIPFLHKNLNNTFPKIYNAAMFCKEISYINGAI